MEFKYALHTSAPILSQTFSKCPFWQVHVIWTNFYNIIQHTRYAQMCMLVLWSNSKQHVGPFLCSLENSWSYPTQPYHRRLEQRNTSNYTKLAVTLLDSSPEKPWMRFLRTSRCSHPSRTSSWLRTANAKIRSDRILISSRKPRSEATAFSSRSKISRHQRTPQQNDVKLEKTQHN